MITRRAYAKINLALSVGPPLPAGDPNAGMHPIASWMHAVDLYDEVETTPGGSGWRVEWAVDAPRASAVDWPEENDLVVRALGVMEREVGRPLKAGLRVLKRIPVGGGLGGGSSDAAATMMAANEAFALGVPLERLRAWSRQVGSDVAFFLDDATPPRPATVGGLGDRIARAPAARGWVVLVVPPFGCPTGAVYRAYDGQGARALREKDVERMAAAGRLEPASLFNDLMEAAEQVRPELRAYRARVEAAAGAPVLMSGSGSALFVYAPAEQEARRVEGAVKNGMPQAAVRAVRLV